jgi:hypothetical protein
MSFDTMVGCFGLLRVAVVLFCFKLGGGFSSLFRFLSPVDIAQ